MGKKKWIEKIFKKLIERETKKELASPRRFPEHEIHGTTENPSFESQNRSGRNPEKTSVGASGKDQRR